MFKLSTATDVIPSVSPHARTRWNWARAGQYRSATGLRLLISIPLSLWIPGAGPSCADATPLLSFFRQHGNERQPTLYGAEFQTNRTRRAVAFRKMGNC